MVKSLFEGKNRHCGRMCNFVFRSRAWLGLFHDLQMQAQNISGN